MRALLAGLCCSVLACSCASEPPKAGFAERFESLYVTRPGAVTWRRTSTDPGAYVRIDLNPLQAQLGRGAGGLRPSSAALDAIALAYERGMRRALEPEYPCSGGGGSGTLRVGATLTDRVTVAELRRGSWAQSLGADPSGNLNTVGLEIRFHDGATGAMVAALASVAEAGVLERSLRGAPVPAELEVTFASLGSRLKIALDQARRS